MNSRCKTPFSKLAIAKMKGPRVWYAPKTDRLLVAHQMEDFSSGRRIMVGVRCDYAYLEKTDQHDAQVFTLMVDELGAMKKAAAIFDDCWNNTGLIDLGLL